MKSIINNFAFAIGLFTTVACGGQSIRYDNGGNDSYSSPSIGGSSGTSNSNGKSGASSAGHATNECIQGRLCTCGDGYQPTETCSVRPDGALEYNCNCVGHTPGGSSASGAGGASTGGSGGTGGDTSQPIDIAVDESSLYPGMNICPVDNDEAVFAYEITTGTTVDVHTGVTIHRVGNGKTTSVTTLYVQNGDDVISDRIKVTADYTYIPFLRPIQGMLNNTARFVLYASFNGEDDEQFAFEVEHADDLEFKGDVTVHGYFPLRGNTFTLKNFSELCGEVHDCAITSETTVPWGDGYAIAGNEDRYVFLQNDGGQGHPAIQRMYSVDGSLLSLPNGYEIPNSNWSTSIFASESGFVVTSTLDNGTGWYSKLDPDGDSLVSVPMGFKFGNEGENGSDVLVYTSSSPAVTPGDEGKTLTRYLMQIVSPDGELGDPIPMGTTTYDANVSYVIINQPSRLEDTIAVPTGIAFTSGPMAGTFGSSFYIRPIDQSTEGVFVDLEEDASQLASWADGKNYFLWFTRKGGKGEGVYRISKDGTITDTFSLDERPITVIKRPSGFATLVSSNLALYRYTSDGEIRSANMLIPAYSNDGTAGIEVAAADDDHYVVATPDKANNITRLHFVTCDPETTTE